MRKKNFGYVLATKKLVDERLPVRFMYHEKPDNKDDSGWRFFSGLEDQEYTDNPDNIAIYDINTVMNIDESIWPYLDSIEGMAFEREGTKGTFKVCEDFSFEPEKN
mgnify:CR=1 FL=1